MAVRIKPEKQDKMDLQLRALKAFHSVSAGVDSIDNLERQRREMELFSRLVTPGIGIHFEGFTLGELSCEWIIPDFAHRRDRVVLYLHGGGYTCGGLMYARILASKLAIASGCRVVSVEYRLAPEHPYPAAIEDAQAVWDHLMYLGYGAGQVIVAGDSAGGNLTLELCLKLKDNNRMLPGALVLMSPWTDMRCTASSYETWKDKDPILTMEYVRSVRQAYAGENADFSDPVYSPLLGDLEGFPPTLIQVGSNEILRSDSERLYKRLNQQGYARLEVYKGGWHVFQQLPVPKAAKAMEDVKLFLERTIL